MTEENSKGMRDAQVSYCILCNESFLPRRHNQGICHACRRVIPYAQTEFLKNDYAEIVAFRRRYRQTGIRSYTPPFERERLKNIGPANQCPEDCKFRGTTDGAPSCDYILKMGCRRPKDAGPVGKDCKCYVPATKEEIIERSRRQFADGRFTW